MSLHSDYIILWEFKNWLSLYSYSVNVANVQNLYDPDHATHTRGRGVQIVGRYKASFQRNQTCPPAKI